ncbi:MAG: Lrp/AsnC family transcriptional regulator [Rhodospirillales bacterium]|nr:Lrp/AsnC family transcriptional regulator [Rhodospirillales bacterium]
MKRLRYENSALDQIDRRLLAALNDNARISNTALGRLVGLSAPSVAERLKRLEEAGVISGYAATIDLEALGLPIAAWVRVKPIPGKMANVLDVLNRLPEVVSCDRVTGEDCFVVRVQVASVQALEKTIDAILPYATTSTSVIQSSPIRHRVPGLESE